MTDLLKEVLAIITGLLSLVAAYIAYKTAVAKKSEVSPVAVSTQTVDAPQPVKESDGKLASAVIGLIVSVCLFGWLVHDMGKHPEVFIDEPQSGGHYKLNTERSNFFTIPAGIKAQFSISNGEVHYMTRGTYSDCLHEKFSVTTTKEKEMVMVGTCHGKPEITLDLFSEPYTEK